VRRAGLIGERERGSFVADGELPRREDLWRVFDELDFQMACQVYLWSLPLVSYGGTALISLFIGLGILMSVQAHRKLVNT